MMVRVERLTANAVVPQYQSGGAAGLDLHAADDYEIAAGGCAVIPTGIAVAIPENHVGLIWDRGSMAKRGLHTLAGVVDSDYRGEIMVVLFNTNSGFSQQSIHKGDRIAQMLIVPCPQVRVMEVGELDETDRGEGRFGSTGT